MNRRRVFVAITIPMNVQKHLLHAVETWQEQDLPIRWTKPENIHITLLFIGNVDDEELSRIASILSMAAEGVQPFDIMLNRIGIGPNVRQPRMVWAEGESFPELIKLQQRVEESIMSDRRVTPSEEDIEESDPVNRESSIVNRKSFQLHVTLGRMIPFPWKQLGKNAPKIEKTINVSFPVHSIELMESESGPKGPTYTILSSASFGE